jgi:transcriptional regulator with XRE-family HTH domain
MPDGSTNTQPAGVEVDGNALRELRKSLGYTLVAFAPKADISFGYLSQIERGWRKRVSPPVFLQLIAALGIQDNPGAIKHKDAA